MDWQLLWTRMLRAAKLDIHLYEEVEADRTALKQAGLVVVLSSLAAGIGGFGVGGIGGLIVITFAAQISTKLLPEPQTQSDLGELLRTTGFSASPGLLRVLGIVPGLAGIVGLAAGVWMLVAMVIAVRQALDYQSTWRAIGVCLIGWIIQIAVLGGVMALFGLGSTPG